MAREKRNSIRDAATPDVEPDMTPLIDVVFLLIIFFMIISVFNQMERDAVKELPVSRFQATIEPDVTADRMIVNILEDGTISLFGRGYDIEGFRRLLRERRGHLQRISGETGEAPIILRGHKKARYEIIRQVLSAVYGEDFRKIMFAAYEYREDRE